MFVIATSQILKRFTVLSDLTKGSLIGIGLLILSVAFGNFKSAQ